MPIDNLETITALWKDFSQYVHVIKTKDDYDNAIELVDSVVDVIGDNENHPLSTLVELLHAIIRDYEYVEIPEFNFEQK